MPELLLDSKATQSDARREGRVAEYWNNLDKYDFESDNALIGYKMLQIAQEIFLSKVEHTVVSDEGSSMHDLDSHYEVSPVTSNESPDVKMKEDGIPSNVTAQVHIIEDDFENKCSLPKKSESAEVIETDTQTAVSPMGNETEKHLLGSPLSPPRPQLSWLDLKHVEGWYYTRAPSSKYPLLDWLYIRPGFTKMDTLGEHCFRSEEDAVKYALDHQEILKKLKPYEAISPLSSKVSCAAPSSQPAFEEVENMSSSSNSGNRDEDENFETESHDLERSASTLHSTSTESSVMSQLLWIDLKRAEGWTYTIAPSLDLETTYYYVQPGCSVKGIENVDWFKSEEAAVDYALKHPECLQNLEVSALAPDSPESQ